MKENAPWAPGFIVVSMIVMFAFFTRGAHPLVAGMSKTGHGGKHAIEYSLAWLLCMNSLVKLVVCLIALPIQYSKTEPGKDRDALIAFNFKTYLCYSFPAVMYQISDVAYVLMLVVMNPALGLPMASLKILATGILVHSFAATSFGKDIFKKLNDIQWIAVILLLIGVVLTTPMGEQVKGKESAMGNVTLGLVWAIVYSTCSALANVGTELLFKKTLSPKSRLTQGLLIQNIQLYSWASAVCLAYMFIKEGKEVLAKGPFHDFNSWTWGLLILDAFGGLGASLVFKYLNNITFLFINVATMVAATLISVPLFKFDFSGSFIVALVIITLATYLYKRVEIMATASDLWDHYMGIAGLRRACSCRRRCGKGRNTAQADAKRQPSVA